MKKQIVGYTAGVYDMFHIGHLNLLRNAKEHCDYLIVAVNTDELTSRYKGKLPVIPIEERMEIVKSIKYVDEVVQADEVVQVDDDGGMPIYHKYSPDCIIIGDDHMTNPRWQRVDEYLRSRGSKVVYVPYTTHTSSTKLKGRHEEKIED